MVSAFNTNRGGLGPKPSSGSARFSQSRSGRYIERVTVLGICQHQLNVQLCAACGYSRPSETRGTPRRTPGSCNTADGWLTGWEIEERRQERIRLGLEPAPLL